MYVCGCARVCVDVCVGVCVGVCVCLNTCIIIKRVLRASQRRRTTVSKGRIRICLDGLRAIGLFVTKKVIVKTLQY